MSVRFVIHPIHRSRPPRCRGRALTGHACIALAVFTSPLVAQAPVDTVRVTLAGARTRGLKANPDLVAARLDTSIARGRFRQARILRFNPSADVLTSIDGGNLETGVSQEIEVFGQRGVRMSAGRARMERATAGIANATRLTVGDVDRTFYRLVSAVQRTALAQDVLALNERLADVAQRQLKEGEISRLDFNLAVVELGRARARALSTRREREQAVIELGRLIGVPQGTPILPVLDSTQHQPAADTAQALRRDVLAHMDSMPALDLEHLTALALSRRPDLDASAAAVRQTRAEASLARREALPNLVARGVVEQPSGRATRTIRPGLGITLPFFNRNQGDVQALRAAARQSELERASLALRVRAEVAIAVASYQSAAAEVEVLETTVLVPARQNRQLVEIAYREGKVGLPVLLLIQNQAIDAELDYWAAWLAEREALAALAEATGQNVDDASSGAPR